MVNNHEVTISAGCTLANRNAPVDLARLFKAADDALLTAKQQGRNRTVLAPTVS
jgi:PleD family two-component response regulator